MVTQDLILVSKINRICRNAIAKSDSENLNELLDVFGELYPDWKEKFNEKDMYTYGDMPDEALDLVAVEIPKSTSLSQYKVRVEDTPELTNKALEKKVRVLHLTNKVAHGIETKIKGYLLQYIRQEIDNGNEDIKCTIDVEKDTDANMSSTKFKTFCRDFIKKFPFSVDLSNETVQKYFSHYVSVDRKIDEIQEEVNNAKKRISEVGKHILEQQQDLADDKNFKDRFLDDYLRKLPLMKSLESEEKLSKEDQASLDGMHLDRVALTNFIPEETLSEVEELYLKNADLFEKIKRLNIQKDDYTDRVLKETGIDVKGAFKTLNNFMKKYKLSEKDIQEFVNMDLSLAKKAYDNCMAKKDDMIVDIHQFIQTNRMGYISYGIASAVENKGKKDAEKNIFIIDLPGYCQVSVHFLPELLGKELDKHGPVPDYDMQLNNDGRREQVLLVSENTKAFRDFRRKIEADTLIAKKMGFDEMTKLSKPKKDNLKRIYAILNLDIGDDESEREYYLRVIGKKDSSELSDSQKKLLNRKMTEARGKRKAMRHQLGVLLRLPKDLL